MYFIYLSFVTLLLRFYVIWNILICGAQILGWLKFGKWQSIPFGTICLSIYAKANLKVYHPNPIDKLIPSIFEYHTFESVASSIVPSFLGIQRVIVWILELPFLFIATLFGFLLVLVLIVWIGDLIKD
jgi:hypothetical protein